LSSPEEDIKKAQKEFDETVGTCVVFFNKNGMNIEVVRQMLHQSLDEIIKDYMEKRD